MKNIFKKFLLTTFVFSLLFSFTNAFALDYEWEKIEDTYRHNIQNSSEGTYYYWNTLSVSEDATKMVITTANGGDTYVSTNGGESWASTTSIEPHNWSSVVYTGDGTKLIGINNLGVYSSSDNGNTWSKIYTVFGDDIDSSSDGKYLAIVDRGSYVYTSSDFGVTWTAQTSAGQRNWKTIAISSDGKNMIAGVGSDSYGYVYTSTTSGQTWATSTSLFGRWVDVDISNDGKNMAAVAYDGYAYTSNDYGATWKTHDYIGTKSWTSVNISNDGLKIYAGTMYNYVYTSSDEGLNFKEETIFGDKFTRSIVSALNGEKVFLIDADYMYIGEPAELSVGNNNRIFVDSNLNKLTFYGKTNVRHDSHGIEYCNSGDVDMLCSYNMILQETGPFSVAEFKMIADNIVPNTYYQYRFFADNEKGRVYSSNYSIKTDSKNWAALYNSGQRDWEAITISDDGKNIAAVVGYDKSVYLSKDGGQTWEAKTLEQTSWWGIDSSPDGKYLAVSNSKNIWTSSDYGENWSTTSKPAEVTVWGGVSISDNGQVIGAVYSGRIYTSKDAGQTWTKSSEIVVNSKYVDVSNDGIRIISSDGGNYFNYISNDSGQTWEKMSYNPNIQSYIASSNDGLKLMSIGNEIFISDDAGIFWRGISKPSSVTSNPQMVATEAQAENFFVGFQNDYIYIYGDIQKPEIVGNPGRILDENTIEFSAFVDTDHVKRGLEYCKVDIETNSCEYDNSLEELGEYSLGDFTMTLTELESSTYYQYKFFAENEKGISYSKDYTIFTGKNSWISANSPVREWSNLVTSDDGQIVIGFSMGHPIISYDSGKTWNDNVIPSGEYHGALISKNNNVIIIEGYESILSLDGGQTWDSINLFESEGIALSPDGKYLYVISGGIFGTIEVESLLGGEPVIVSMYEQELLANEKRLRLFITDDGEKFIAIGSGVYVSEDLGVTWEKSNTPIMYSVTGADISADGETIVITRPLPIEGINPGYSIISKDGGKTLEELRSLGAGYWYDVAVSNDGYKMLITNYYGETYLSLDGGHTWNKQTKVTEGYRKVVSMSGSGEAMFTAHEYSGYEETESIYSWHNRLPEAQNVRLMVR